jgi:hypothetical protein
MSEVNFGERGASPFIHYFNSLMSVSTTLWQQQLFRWTTLAQGMLLGTATSEQLADVVLGPWRDAMSLSGFAPNWWMRYVGHVPSLVFIVDTSAETQGPVAAMTPVSVPDVAPRLSPILDFGGGETVTAEESRATEVLLPPECVQARITQGGNRLEVTLVNLKGTPTQPWVIQPGLYQFFVYVTEATTQRPLAIVHVLQQ